MERSIEINQGTCIRCGHCVRVCPSAIIIQDEKPDDRVSVINMPACIVCGHCVAVCPTSSVEHSAFPAGKVHKIDTSLLPLPEQVMMLCRTRRSNRAFSPKPVPEEFLSQILEAAHRAPTASNRQQVSFTLITDPEKLRTISEYTLGIFGSVAKKLQNPLLKPLLKPIMPEIYKQIPRLTALVEEYENGRDRILRGATAVILIHTPKDLDFGMQDSNLAYQNGSLMAESLGVSQFYTGFVCRAIKQDKRGGLTKALGIKGTVHAGMALGMPEFRYPNYIDKKEIVVDRL